MAKKQWLPEECSAAMNKVLSYELHISDAYLSMAYNYIGKLVQPHFATFFEDQADMKRGNAKEFLEYLGAYGNKICLPVFKRPEIENWGTGIRALECALELEEQLTTLLLDLKTTASTNKERKVILLLAGQGEPLMVPAKVNVNDDFYPTDFSEVFQLMVLEFIGKYLKEQKKSTKNLQTQLRHCLKLASKAQEEEKA